MDLRKPQSSSENCESHACFVSSLIKKFVVVYLDATLVFCKTEAEHETHIRVVALQPADWEEAKITPKVKFLGHVFTVEGTAPDPREV